MNGFPTSEAVSPSALLVLRGWLEGGTALLDAGKRVVAIDESLASWAGVPADQLIGQPLTALLARESELAAPWFDELDAETPFHRRTFPLSNGAELHLAVEAVAFPGGWTVRLSTQLPAGHELAEASFEQHMGSDGARRQMFVRLLRAETQLHSLFHRWPGVIFSQRADFSFHYASPQIESLTGVPIEDWQRHSHHFWEAIHEADVEELRIQLRRSHSTPQGVSSTYRIRNRTSGRVAYILEHRQAITAPGGLLLGYEGIWLDVTRQTIAEKRLSTAAWKETLALLTMGLAHDFSNIMAGIHSLSESFLAQLEAGHPFREGLSLIRQNSLQASQLVHRIINLHHGRTGERNYHNLNEIITDLVDLVRKIIPRRIEVSLDCAPESLPLYADAVEFRQVLVNLILNAADAMASGGRLTFRTARFTEWPAQSFIQGTRPRLPCVCLEVADTGCGIPQEQLPLIFDPFFTTKAVNKGSGLGLYNARLFVDKHYGAISVESSLNQGTTFRIWLPECDFTEAERNAGADEGSPRRSLVVLGSDGPFLHTTTEFLRSHGFHVVVATQPELAVNTLVQGEYPFSGFIVLQDKNTGGLDQVLAAVRRRCPHVRTILQFIGINLDEIDSQVLCQADLILSPDLSENVVLEKLSNLLK